ncbi:NAD(P)/FAD-dependent oxidoreductase [Paraburkholderia oxyphila]|uniref:NAD(P)/FAD-dependent oxidoreductase n=1 Tax=Paraburkholderia oxyphila TaxID=614212 RepID=UPI0005BB3769|nr:FAD-dependent oxidoreductase [Paraburkholderia oxyphila]
MNLNRVIVVGGSVAGLRAVETLRQEGFGGEIMLVGGEAHLPYDRPPLTKQILTGEIGVEQLCYRDCGWFDRNNVELCLGTAASALDVHARRLQVGERWLPFDGLIIATGARPRRLRQPVTLAGIHTLRTIEDALAVKAQMLPGLRMVIIGAGFIGSEVASSAAACGVQVTIVELAGSAMARAVGPQFGRVLGALHDEFGVSVVCNARVAGFGGGERVQTVRLEDGWELPADIVVVGIGIEPNTEWLAGAGLTISNGLLCDENLNAGPDNVFGAGDVVAWPNHWWGDVMRAEQWLVAADQGRHAARNLLAGPGRASPFSTVPYFWSDQYGCRIQAAGRTDMGELVTLAGDAQQRPFVGAFRYGSRLTGVVAINAPKVFAVLRRSLENHSDFDSAVASIESELKTVD